MERKCGCPRTAFYHRVFPSPHLSLSLSLLLLTAGCELPSRTPAAPAPPLITAFDQFRLDEPGDNWVFRTPELWRIAQEGDRRFLQMAFPPQRPAPPGVPRPREYTLYAPYQFRSFSLSARIRVDSDSAATARDAVVIFGWQDDTHFYYAHLANTTGQWENTIVRVDGGSRVSLVAPARHPAPIITDAAWHKVDVLCDASKGSIEVYVDAYDPSDPPVFKIVDRTYEWGHVGLGSFDDHASFANVKIEGEARRTSPPRLP
jgi:hypothetical protein